jgi:hypothetical protein
MAIRFAVANGNWSNPATWNGGTLPASDDDVFANGFTVTINGTFTVLTIRNTANTLPLIIAGGGFTFANGGNLTCSNSQAIFVGAANRPVLEMSLSSGNVGTFTGSVLTITNSTNFIGIRLSGTGTLNLIGDFGNTSSSNITTRTIEVTNNGILNIVGNLSSSNLSSGGLGNTLSITSNCVVNITGDVTGNNNNLINTNATIYNNTTANVLNITGNVNAATNGNSTAIFLSGTINIVGNVTGNVGQSAIVTGTSTVDVTGVITSGNARPAIRGSELTFVIVRGNVINTDTYAAIYAGRVVIDDNVTSWQFKDSTNTVTRTLYTPGVALGNPATSNVRNGVTYGPALELTGTAFIPTADNVRKGVPVDATIGTADLTAADMWNYLASNITTAGSIGEVVKNIKTKTDLIPNNPTSNESVGAIVASYNI